MQVPLQVVLLGWLLLWLASGHATASQITIANLDGTSEGFNDPSPVTPVGGNIGTTIGDQRLKVFEYAARIWESVVNSNIEIVVNARFDPLSCSSTQAILGSAGAISVVRDFTGAPVVSTWYPTALANSLANTDLITANADINATFNSAIDNNNNCLNNTNWYYGLDGSRPGGTIELLSVVMHEIGHGLGFQTFVDLPTGRRLGWPNGARNDAYMLNLEDHSLNKTWDQLSDNQRIASAVDTPDLHWIGNAVSSRVGDFSAGVDNGHIRMYAPTLLQGGSSVSHFSKAVAPNELMEPTDTGPKPGPGLARELMIDIGWVAFADSKPFSSPLANRSILEGDTLNFTFVIGDNDSPISGLTLAGTSLNTSLVSNNDIFISGSGRTRTLQLSALSGNIGTTTISISVSDIETTSIETFDLTVLFNNPPGINIQSPGNNDSFLVTDTINFQATATDLEDGDISGNIQWTSSLDGSIGSGATFSAALSQGIHTITASVTDNLGKNASTVLSISVISSGDSDADGLDDAWEIVHFGNLTRNGSGDYDTDGLTDAEEEQLTTNPTLDDTDNDGVTDGDEVNIYNIDPLISNTGDVAPRGTPNNQKNGGDIVVLTRLATGIITADALESILADLNSDGLINAADLLLLQQQLLTAP